LWDTRKLHSDGKVLDVKMQMEKYDFSAHPSQEEMLKSLKKWSPEKAVLVHGDKEILPLFKKTIKQELGIESVIPELGKEITL